MVRKMIMTSLMIRIAAAAAVVLAIFGAGATVSYKYVHAQWDKETQARTAAESAAILTRVKNNERMAEQQRIDNRKITKAHNDEINAVRAAIARAPGLRVGPALCSGFAAGAQADRAGSGNAADTGSWVLSGEMDAAIKALILETEDAAATARAAQEFIRANGMAP